MPTIGVLLIGIRYKEGTAHLNGCHNDIVNMYTFLKSKFTNSKYTLDITVIADYQGHLCDNLPCLWPTKYNILNSFKLLRDRNYKKYFIHYSGHGTSQPDINGDEKDGYDEVICPYDYLTSGCIEDDVLNSHFLQYLSSDCRVRITMDCCRSGTIWDLKYRYNNTIAETLTAPLIKCNVIVLSGCKDNQYAYDVYTEGEFQGAFTYCFLKSITSGKNIIVTKLIKIINNYLLHGGWVNQTPRLTSSVLLTNKDIFFDFDNENSAFELHIIKKNIKRRRRREKRRRRREKRRRRREKRRRRRGRRRRRRRRQRQRQEQQRQEQQRQNVLQRQRLIQQQKKRKILTNSFSKPNFFFPVFYHSNKK